ncbi:hypothetical protein A2U01_0069589, partial [Trifolium medium]|nr:hypothetical protein [Trifolium medium]
CPVSNLDQSLYYLLFDGYHYSNIDLASVDFPCNSPLHLLEDNDQWDDHQCTTHSMLPA